MILIGLGANLDGKYGSAAECLNAAPALFAAKNVDVVAMSSLWKSAPVPVSDQPWYHNAVCAVETALLPHDLLMVLSEIENETGRVRHKQNEARVLDLDLLAYHNEIIESDILLCPHPRLHERAFVLRPLQEVAPDWGHPVSGQLVEDMIKVMPEGQEIERCTHDFF